MYVSLWPKTFDINALNKRICRINYFLKHTITLTRIETNNIVTPTHLLCHVSWFKPHAKEDWFGYSAIICKDEIEEESLYLYSV